MDKDTVKGKVTQAKGKAKEKIGSITDDEKKVLEGKTEQAKGKAQEKYGKIKDALKD